MGVKNSLLFRWLGVAGIELVKGEKTLIIDPYLTRVPFRKMFFTKVLPDKGLIKAHIKRCSGLLITHAHIDHLMDAPEVIKNTGCIAYGSENTCRILSFCGVDKEKIKEVAAGDILEIGNIKIEVFDSIHRRILGFNKGKIKRPLKAPLKARQYIMDSSFSFHIDNGDIALMTDPGIDNTQDNFKKADVLFIGVTYLEKYLRSMLEYISPKLIIPIHWDDIFSPLSKPIRPFFKPPSRKSPFIKRIVLDDLKKLIEKIDPGIKLFFPEIFKTYDLEVILGA